MRKINNAFAAKNKDFDCFGCSLYNPIGLKMEFFKDDTKFWSEWMPSEHMDGWAGILHGGIQACLMDETAEWLIFTTYGRSAVTMELNIKYKKPLSSLGGKVKVTVQELSFSKNIAEVKATILDFQNQICTEAIGKFYVFSINDSIEKHNFPDISEF